MKQPLVEILRNGQRVGQIRLREVMAQPEVFRRPNESVAAALNPDGTTNSTLNPAKLAKLGSIVSVYATGFGPTNSGGGDGEIPVDNLPVLTLPVSV